MTNKKNTIGEKDNTPQKNSDEMEGFKSFIKKKKSQNEVLKKIISKLPIAKSNKINK